MKLFEPVAIGKLQLPNRLVMSPMTTGYAGLDQLPTPRLVDFLVERARGGVGLVTLEACVVDRRHREVPQSMHFSSDDVIAPHRALVDAVHAAGAKIQPQIVHPGPDALSPQLEKIPSLGPSVIPSYLTGTPCRALEAEELPAIVAQFASAVRRVREAGYDGIELHAAHGYMLLGSFLSPWRNKREDAYAGRKREGRLRLLLEVLAAIRAEVGRDFPITLRISGYERVPGGRPIDDTAQIAPDLVAAGVDAFHVSGGVIDRLTSMIVTGADWGEAHNLAAARALKNAVDVPVMTVGRVHTPDAAEAILARGDADLVVMGRPLLVDPELPLKWRGGRALAIRRCISCENCIDSMERGSMNCAVNPRSGREGELSYAPARVRKHVVVVGAGTGGLECARIAALRGHRVTLIERERFLGGALLVAALVHPENAPLLEHLLQEVKRLPIEVRLGRTFAPADLDALGADAVVVATGGRIEVPRIPGDEQPQVLSGAALRALIAGRAAAPELARLPLHRRALLPVIAPLARFATPARLRALSRLYLPFGRRVAIVGADLAGLELAEFLATRGRRVSLLEPGARLAPEIGLKRLTEHMQRLDRLGVAVNTRLRVERITPRGLVIEPAQGGAREVRADTVIVAGTLQPDLALFEALQGRASAVHHVGDCSGLGLIRKATEEAARVACAL